MKEHFWAVAILLGIVLFIYSGVLFPLKPLRADDMPMVHSYEMNDKVVNFKSFIMRPEGFFGTSGYVNQWLLCYPIAIFDPKYFSTLLFPYCAWLAGIGMYAFLRVLNLKFWA